MDEYRKSFSRVIKEAIAPQEVAPMPPGEDVKLPPEETDSAAWEKANPDIQKNPDVSKQFDVEGLPPEETGKHADRIQGWRNGIDTVSGKLEEIYKYAAQVSDKPGTDEIYKTVGNLVESILADLGTLGGHLRTLANKIEIGLKRSNEKQRRSQL